MKRGSVVPFVLSFSTLYVWTSRFPGAFDQVSHFEGLEDDHEHACGKVGQGPLECKTNGQAGRTQYGDKRGRLDAQLIEGGHDLGLEHGRGLGF